MVVPVRSCVCRPLHLKVVRVFIISENWEQMHATSLSVGDLPVWHALIPFRIEPFGQGIFGKVRHCTAGPSVSVPTVDKGLIELVLGSVSSIAGRVGAASRDPAHLPAALLLLKRTGDGVPRNGQFAPLLHKMQARTRAIGEARP